MRVAEVRYSKKFNLGNYESEEFSLSAVLDEGEDAQEILKHLKEEVNKAYTGETTGEQDDTSYNNTESDAADEENNEEDSGSSSDDGETDSDQSTDSHDDDSEDADEQEDEKPVKKKKFKSKAQVYDRENETHKELFTQVLKEVAPDWKKTPESKVKAKDASQKLVGKEFLDSDGEVLETFKADVKKLMKAKK